MKRLFILAISCLFFVVCLKPARDNEYDPDNPDKAYLAGSVYNHFDNDSPMAHAMVVLMHDGYDWADTTTADADGGYVFDEVDPGLYEISAEGGHFMSDVFPESLPAGRNDTFDVCLHKAFFDFEDEALNTGEPHGFSVVETTWSVVDDPDQGHVYMGTTPGTGLSIAVVDPVLQDFSFESLVKVDTSSGNSFFTGILFRFHDIQNFYGVIFSSSRIELLRAHAGAWTPIDTIPRSFSVGQWYRLSVECCGDHIQVFLDNSSTPLFDVHDGTFADGQAGLFIEHLASVRFDDVYIDLY
jgi:hypothetical protein